MTIFAPPRLPRPGLSSAIRPERGDRPTTTYADGSGLRNLTRNHGRDGHPVWSSDGRTVGFVSNRGGSLHQPAFGIAWSPLQKQSG